MKKNGRRLTILIAIICMGGLVLLFLTKVINGFKDMRESFENDLPITYSIPSEDSTLISKEYLNRLKVGEIVNFKQREPISVLLLDSNYYLVVASANLKRHASIKEIIHENIESVDPTTGETYSILDLGNSFKFQYQSKPLSPVSDVYLTLSGDSLTSKWSDSIARFHLSAEDLSIRYADKAPIDIYLTGRQLLIGKKLKGSVDLLVLIRSSRIYFLLMTPINAESKISPDLIYNVISGR